MNASYNNPSDIKVAVVGYGGIYNMGKIHLNDVQKAGMTPRAAVELDATRLALAPQDFPGIQTYTTVEEMLAKSDANLVILITPHNTHAPLALQCIAAGRHVVCEKPFAITTEECDEMIAAAKKAGVMLSTFHNRHWDGSVVKALEVVQSGNIGDIVRIECHMGQWNKPGDIWRASKSISGGILYDWGVHLLEYALQLVNSEITEVSGFSKRGFWANLTKWKDDTIEDEAFATVRFKSGAWVTLCVTHIDSNPKRGMFEVTGTKGSMVLEYDTHEIIVRDGEKTIVTKAKNPKEKWEMFYVNIAAHLTKNEPLVITPEWARRPIHILDLADRSAREGRAITARYS
jgi:scyllo-inositol 2-dehydrogenase (NADP+)|uniref:Gfo/Idh/MocA family protein n=1 Tax=Cephaloticoccus sp. TaxID=1985742 RepID=UPI00404B42FD